MRGSKESIVLGMGCFWGAEKRMAGLDGVIEVECGYANGDIDGNYEAVLQHDRRRQRGLSSLRNHAEVVRISFDPARVDLDRTVAHGGREAAVAAQEGVAVADGANADTGGGGVTGTGGHRGANL